MGWAMSEIVTNDIINYAEAKSDFSKKSDFIGSITRMRFQLLSGMIVAVIAPAIARGQLERFVDQLASYDNSIIGTSLAFLLSFIFFQKITSFPGIRQTQYILPAFTVGYLIVIVLFFFLRLEYSRYQFLASFSMTTVWFFFLFIVSRKSKKIKLAVIPGGQVDLVKDLKFVDLNYLTSPKDTIKKMPIVVDMNSKLSPEWEKFITERSLAGQSIYHVKQVTESLSGRSRIDKISENKFGSLTPTTVYAPAKFYIDWLGALTAFVFLLPLLAAVAIAIRLESKGPAIFKQQRMGFRGKPFTIYKFRSMRVQDPNTIDRNSEMTQSDDDRITRVGRFIRKNRIDELPQLFNILRGEMSWIGPRPEALKLSSWYEEKLPYYQFRHFVRPGITGWAQVNQGHVTSLEDAEVKLQYDFFYVRNLSLWLDILVLLKTTHVVLTGNGAK